MDKDSVIEKICDILDPLVCCLHNEISSGIMNVDTKEAGEVADIIKDLACAEKDLREAKYYESVTTAMDESSSDGYYGYSSDWYKPKVDQKPYMDAYLRNPDKFKADMRMGYDAPRYGIEYDEYENAKRYYTETGDSTSHDRMRTHGRKYFTETVENMKDIWDNADAGTKVELRENLKELVKYFE